MSALVQDDFAGEYERSNHELAQFAYVASHDLATPLRAVAGYAQLLADRHRGSLDPEAGRWLDFVLDGCARMQSLIDDLLSYARVGGSDISFAEVGSGALVARVLDDFEHRLSECGGAVHVDPLPAVWGDHVQLRQLFQNLVSNALKFHRPDVEPRVTISARQVRGRCEFTVADNGIGVDARHRERIFGMFQRLHSSDEFPGSGIGLSVCREIVERHGGTIWLDERPGPGVTFVFNLPLAWSQPQDPQ
ncbi:MAG TPA: ATP-binding protein [Candidatus Angelobacter sp.]|jgi:light-regulated signal transduction histidine kinase (bacteriophytochrome)|nr:ATP-binding protein [Candidatus Angelobacter sp.]